MQVGCNFPFAEGLSICLCPYGASVCYCIVRLIFMYTFFLSQDATKVLLLLKSNFFGSVTEEQIDAFKKSCQKRFPLAVVFADVASTIATLTTTQSSSPTSSATVTTSATGMTMCPVEQQSKTTQQQQNKGSEIKAN